MNAWRKGVDREHAEGLSCLRRIILRRVFRNVLWWWWLIQDGDIPFPLFITSARRELMESEVLVFLGAISALCRIDMKLVLVCLIEALRSSWLRERKECESLQFQISSILGAEQLFGRAVGGESAGAKGSFQARTQVLKAWRVVGRSGMLDAGSMARLGNSSGLT